MYAVMFIQCASFPIVASSVLIFYDDHSLTMLYLLSLVMTDTLMRQSFHIQPLLYIDYMKGFILF